MIKKIFLLSFILILSSCSFETPTEFSEKALNDELISLNASKLKFREIINQHNGKKIVIDFWASWCADCIKGLPKIKNLQEEYPEVVFLFLSVDKSNTSWKKGIQRFNINGKHYNLPKGMKTGELVEFIGLSWIPRYMVIDKNGMIKLFNATKSSDKRIVEALNE